VTYARITGTGSYLPKRVVTNTELQQWVETNHEWIVERTGIHARHLAAPDETTCDMAEQAARAALAAAQCEASDIDLIVLGTTTPDRVYPSTACLLQNRLGSFKAAAFDVQAVCSGFVYALSIADNFIRAGSAQRVLVIGADTFSRTLDWQDRSTCVLFGDGAGAVVLEASDTLGIYGTQLHADGRHQDTLTAVGTVNQGKIVGDGFTRMQGGEVFKFAVNALSEAAEQILATYEFSVADVDWFIPHQANIRIIQKTAKKLKFALDKVIITVAEQGNTSAASIPLALDVAVRDGRIQRGQRLLLEGIGGGFTWGAVLLIY